MTAPTTVHFDPPGAPPITTEFVSVQNGHLTLGGKRFVGLGANFTTWAVGSSLAWNGSKLAMDPQQMESMRAQIANFANAGCRVARINDFDGGLSSNIFAPGNTPQTTTRKLDPTWMQALCFFISVCRANSIHVMLTLHQLRRLVPGDKPAWACPTFDECLTIKAGGPLGTVDPYMWFDPGLQQLLYEFDSQLLGWPDPYNNGVPLGKNPALLAVTLHNEVSLVKQGPFFTAPVYAQLLQANAQQWCNQNLVAWIPAKGLFSLHAPQIQQWLAAVETEVLAARAAHVRTLTPAIVIGGTWFGSEAYSGIVGPCAASDATDCHFYSRQSATDSNGFTAIDGTAQRSRFAASLAGCSWGKPQFCSEFGFVDQSNGQIDPPAEQAPDMEAAVKALVAQDVDVACLYAWGEGALRDQFVNPTVYDSRFNATLLRGFQQLNAWFHDLSLRPTTAMKVAPTNGLYGAGVGPAYKIYGPLTDPALLSVPAGQKVVVAP